MAKELRISASIPLPDDFSQRTELMVRLNPAVKALSEALGTPVTVSDVSVKTAKTKRPAKPVVVDKPTVADGRPPASESGKPPKAA